MGTLIGRALDGWRAPLLLAVGAVGVLGAALFMQHVVGVQPCALCVYQRWPYVITGGLALLTLAFGRRRPVRAGLLGLIGLVLLGDTCLAVFHVGVEYHWWVGLSGCSVEPAATLDELRARLLDGPVVPCDEVSWSLFGVSLAGYNVVVTLALAAFALLAARRALQPKGRNNVV
jgi:disulfide bond formation protein DsbB